MGRNESVHLRIRLRQSKNPKKTKKDKKHKKVKSKKGSQQEKVRKLPCCTTTTRSMKGAEPAVVSGAAKKKPLGYRQQLKKKDPNSYAAFKLQDALDHKIRRLNMTDEQRKEYNRKTAIRMKKMRAKKKEEKARIAEEEKKKPPRRLSKAEISKKVAAEKAKREKAAKYKREERAQWSEEKREEENMKKRVKRREERELISEMRRRLKEEKREEQRKRELEREERENLEALIQEELEGGETSRKPDARRKSLARARASISNDPLIYAQTVVDLHAKASPRKKLVLGKMEQPRSLDKQGIDSIIAQSVQMRLEDLKRKRKKKDLVQRRLLASTLGTLRKYKLQKAGCKQFGVSTKIAQDKEPFKYRNPAALGQTDQETVLRYYDIHSIELPDQKSISKKTLKKTCVLETPIQVLYANFSKEFPEVKVGMSSFFKLRPKHVKTQGTIKYRACLCEYCENASLKLKVVNGVAKSQNIGCAINTIEEELVEISLCPKDGKFHKLECYERSCSKCGGKKKKTTQKYRKKLEEHFKELDMTVSVEWSRWEKVTEKLNKETRKGKKEVKRKARVDKKGTLRELVDELITETGPLAHHLFAKRWQGEQFRNLTSRKLPPGWTVMVLDFAENYTCKAQDEAQAAHWSQHQVTLHPIIAYYNCPDISCPKPIMHSFIFLSDDRTHDHHAVHSFSSAAIQQVQRQVQKSQGPLTKVIRYSDGCGPQYKGRGPFLDISHSVQDNGMPIQHEFFGSRHGKGPSDGESAVVKRQTSMAELSRRAHVSNAENMFQFCEANLTKDEEHFRRTVLYVPSEQIQRDRKREGKTLEGTQKVHSIKTVKPGVVAHRNLSCFCEGCVSGTGECANKKYVRQWTEATMEKGSKPKGSKRDKEVYYHALYLYLSTNTGGVRTDATNRDGGGDEESDGKANEKQDGVHTDSADLGVGDESSDGKAKEKQDGVHTDSADLGGGDESSDGKAKEKQDGVHTDAADLGGGDEELDGKAKEKQDGVYTDAADLGGGDESLNGNAKEKQDEEVDNSNLRVPTDEGRLTKSLAKHFEVGSYVAVIFDDNWWPGEVELIDGDRCLVSFLKKKGDNAFAWPVKKDSLWIQKSDIFSVLPSPPEPISTRVMGFSADIMKSVNIAVLKYLEDNCQRKELLVIVSTCEHFDIGLE